jgi:hypothetical protein
MEPEISLLCQQVSPAFILRQMNPVHAPPPPHTVSLRPIGILFSLCSCVPRRRVLLVSPKNPVHISLLSRTCYVPFSLIAFESTTVITLCEE